MLNQGNLCLLRTYSQFLFCAWTGFFVAQWVGFAWNIDATSTNALEDGVGWGGHGVPVAVLAKAFSLIIRTPLWEKEGFLS